MKKKELKELFRLQQSTLDYYQNKLGKVEGLYEIEKATNRSISKTLDHAQLALLDSLVREEYLERKIECMEVFHQKYREGVQNG